MIEIALMIGSAFGLLLFALAVGWLMLLAVGTLIDLWRYR